MAVEQCVLHKDNQEIAEIFLKKSHYAFFVEKDNGTYIVYSSLSGAVILFSENSYIERLRNVINSDEVLFDEQDDMLVLLKDKKILLDASVNESLLVRMLCEETVVRSRTLEIMLIVTKQCNFRCTYCGQPHEDKKMDIETMDLVVKFVRNQLKCFGYKDVTTTFFGGEPLLESGNIITYFEKLSHMLKEFENVSHTAVISSNGFLLTPNVFDKLASFCHITYQICVDGMDYTHDKTRILCDGKGTWAKIIDNINHMVTTDATFTVILRSNFNDEIAESLDELYDFVVRKFALDPRIVILGVPIRDEGNEDTPEILNEAEKVFYTTEIINMVRGKGLHCLNAAMYNKVGYRVCYASKPSFFIFDENLSVLKCSYVLDDNDNYIGRLAEGGICEFNENKYAKWVYQDYLHDPNCSSCKGLPLCFGKKCPLLFIKNGTNGCNTDFIAFEIEELIRNSY